MYKASDLRIKSKEIFNLASTQPVVITRNGKRYTLTAYDTAKSLNQISKRLDTLELLTKPLRERTTNWGA